VAIPRRDLGEFQRCVQARPTVSPAGFRGDRLAREQSRLAASRWARLHRPWRRRSNAADADSAAVNAVEIQRGRTMKTVDINFIAIGASWLLVGMLLGIGMGAAHNFALAPLHAHINLIGFVCHSVFGMPIGIGRR
jgi:hypothetical protein